MFIVNPTTKAITMTCGDTGSVDYVITGVDLDAEDTVVALWTMRDKKTNTIVKQNVYAVDLTYQTFTAVFGNADTDSLASGNYVYDVRIVVNPEYDSEDPTKIVDGDVVKTPMTPVSIILMDPVGEI